MGEVPSLVVPHTEKPIWGAIGEASPAGHGQEAVIRCMYAMVAKRPYAI
jgi:hypothetical protein